MPARFLATVLVLSLFGLPARADVDFNRDIRPILADTCFQCHGPDEAQRQAELRLDTESGLLGERDGKRIVVPGDPQASELLRRIGSDDPDQQMPPADSKLSLSEGQVEQIRQWIVEGASWQQHWSFVTPQRPEVPKVERAEWVRQPIDYFVLSRLEAEGLQPSPQADKETLIRRATLDITGLPPTPEEVSRFLADESPNAYEKLVDRLFQSPHYGERMAAMWLDAARYADTSGYQNDGPREMWRWRDWVIDALNQGMPFDRFPTEQLAGDLLPNPTLPQLIATGFNRNHRGNAEGGVIPEEFQVEYVVDRVETTGTAWMGLTIGCARCHEHKFDPISQKEFYQVFSFFNNVPEYGRAIKEGNSPPYISAPTAKQQRKLELLDRKIADVRPHLAEDKITAEQRAWEQQRSGGSDVDWTDRHGEVVRYDFDVAGADGAWPIRYRGGKPSYALGVRGTAARFNGERFVDAGDVADFGYFDKFSIAAWIRPEETASGTIVSRMTDAARGDGYYVNLKNGRVQVNLVKRWLDDCIRVETKQRILKGKWTHVLVTYDGSRVAKGITVYLNGQPVSLKVNYDFINQTFAVQQPLRIGAGGGPAGRFQGAMDDVGVYDRCLKADEAAIVGETTPIDEILSVEPPERSNSQQEKLRHYFLARAASAKTRRFHERLLKLEAQRQQLVESFPTVMVMKEMATPRQTHVLMRGEYDKPGEPVSPGVPSLFPSLPESAPPNRLGFAQWLTDPNHPLTARVAVNSYWQMYFGIGLVKTSEDFGTQGERPSHPKLLDWLATEFLRTGWDIKALQRAILISSTYRQSSRVAPELVERDPENRLLARGPRFRMRAEMVRDQALAAAGLLTRRLGGPSVKPYQPGDLWQDIATDSQYVQDHGSDLYRRSLYIYWKRTVVPPAMSAFDGSAREMCRVRPRRTNTPLQALTLMNDVTFVEAARVLAQHVMEEASGSEERLRRIFERVLARQPTDREKEILAQGLHEHLSRFRSDPAATEALVAVGEYPLSESIDKPELAAYTAIASLILNLDEAVTKQ